MYACYIRRIVIEIHKVCMKCFKTEKYMYLKKICLCDTVSVMLGGHKVFLSLVIQGSISSPR